MKYVSAECSLGEAPPTHVAEQLRVMDRVSDDLMEMVSQLERQLENVLRSQSPQPCNNAPVPPEVVPLAGTLRAYNQSVSESVSRIVDILDRLEL